MSVSFIHHQCQTMPLYSTLLSSTSPSSSFLKPLYYTQSYCLPHRLSLPRCFHLHAISLQHSRHIQIVTLRHFPNTLPLSSTSRTLFHHPHSIFNRPPFSWQHPHDALSPHLSPSTSPLPILKTPFINLTTPLNHINRYPSGQIFHLFSRKCGTFGSVKSVY